MLRQNIQITGSVITATAPRKLATYNGEMQLPCDTRPYQKQLSNDVLTDQILYNLIELNSNIGCDQ